RDRILPLRRSQAALVRQSRADFTFQAAQAPAMAFGDGGFLVCVLQPCSAQRCEGADAVAARAVDQGRALNAAQQLVEGVDGPAVQVSGAGDGEVVVGQAGGAYGGGFVEVGGFGVGGEVDDVGDAGGAQGGQVFGGDPAAGVDVGGGVGEAG